jgi:hypothetical protein
MAWVVFLFWGFESKEKRLLSVPASKSPDTKQYRSLWEFHRANAPDSRGANAIRPYHFPPK